jgi:hypothetical protein
MPEALVGVGDAEQHTTEAAGDEVSQEVAPEAESRWDLNRLGRIDESRDTPNDVEVPCSGSVLSCVWSRR